MYDDGEYILDDEENNLLDKLNEALTLCNDTLYDLTKESKNNLRLGLITVYEKSLNYQRVVFSHLIELQKYISVVEKGDYSNVSVSDIENAINLAIQECKPVDVTSNTEEKIGTAKPGDSVEPETKPSFEDSEDTW